MGFRSREGRNPSKRLYAEAKVRLRQREDEHSDLINQLNGDLERRRNSNQNIARNEQLRLNDFIEASDKKLKDASKLRKAIFDTADKALPLLKQKFAEDLAKRELEEQTKQSETVKLKPPSKESKTGGWSGEAFNLSEGIDFSGEADAGPFGAPDDFQGFGGEFVGELGYDGTPDFLLKPESDSHRADTVLSQLDFSQTSLLSAYSNDPVEQAELSNEVGFNLKQRRKINKANILESMETIDSQVLMGLDGDERVIEVALANGEIWTGRINEVGLKGASSPELRAAVVDFLKREALADIALGNGLTAKEVVEKYLPIANRRIAKITRDYNEAFVLGKNQEDVNRARNDLLDAARTKNPDLATFTDNLYKQIEQATAAAKGMGRVNNQGKTTLDLFEQSIDEIGYDLIKSGDRGAALQLVAAIPKTRDKFAWIGKKNGEKFGFDAKTGTAELGKVDSRFSLQTMEGKLSDWETKWFKELQQKKTADMHSLRDRWRKARDEGDIDEMQKIEREFRGPGKEYHLDPAGKLILDSMQNRPDQLEGIDGEQALQRILKEQNGVMYRGQSDRIHSSVIAAEQSRRRQAGEDPIKFLVSPPGMHRTRNANNVKILTKQIQEKIGAVSGKDALTRMGDSGAEAMFTEIWDIRLPNKIQEVKAAIKAGKGVPGIDLGDDEAISQAALGLIFEEMDTAQAKFDEAVQANSKLMPPPLVYNKFATEGANAGWGHHRAINSDFIRHQKGITAAGQIIENTLFNADVKGVHAYLNINLPEGEIREEFFKASLAKSTDVTADPELNRQVKEQPYLNNLWYQLASNTKGVYDAHDLALAASLKYNIPLEISDGEVLDMKQVKHLLKNRKDDAGNAAPIELIARPGTLGMHRQLLHGAGYVSPYMINKSIQTRNTKGSRRRFNTQRNEPKEWSLQRVIFDASQVPELDSLSIEAKCNTAAYTSLAKTEGITSRGTFYGFGNKRDIGVSRDNNDTYGIPGNVDNQRRPIEFDNQETAVNFNRLQVVYEEETGQKIGNLINASSFISGGQRKSIQVQPALAEWIINEDPYGYKYGFRRQLDGTFKYNSRNVKWNIAHECKVGN
jgi:hypothetical protein